jgi:hypothetical protein
VHRRKWIATIIMKDFWIIGFSISEKTGWRGVDFKWERFTFGDLDLKYIKSDLCLFGSLFQTGKFLLNFSFSKGIQNKEAQKYNTCLRISSRVALTCSRTVVYEVPFIYAIS